MHLFCRDTGCHAAPRVWDSSLRGPSANKSTCGFTHLLFKAPPRSQSQGRHPSKSLLKPQCSGCTREDLTSEGRFLSLHNRLNKKQVMARLARSTKCSFVPCKQKDFKRNEHECSELKPRLPVTEVVNTQLQIRAVSAPSKQRSSKRKQEQITKKLIFLLESTLAVRVLANIWPASTFSLSSARQKLRESSSSKD